MASGVAHNHAGEHGLAAQCFEESFALHPRGASAISLANMLLKTAQFDRASAVLDAVSEPSVRALLSADELKVRLQSPICAA